MIPSNPVCDPLPVVFRRGGCIRRFVKDDVPLVAHLQRTVWGQDEEFADLDRCRNYLAEVFLENPCGEAALPSLVYEEEGGWIAGFLGIVPRRMVMNGRRFDAAVSSQFIVHPSSCVPVVALRLAQTFLDGPQDLSIADEANDVSRKIWEGLGGTTLLMRSLYWIRPVRPVEFRLSTLQGRSVFGRLAPIFRSFGVIADALTTRLPPSPFCVRPTRGQPEPLGSSTVLSYIREFSGAGSLCVDYDDRVFDWLLERIRHVNANGRVVAATIRNDQEILGWYVCHLGGARTMELLQLVAKPEAMDDVLDHLIYQTWREGAVAVTGRMEPKFVAALSGRRCLFRRGPWMLIKARDSNLLQSFVSGSACFSRLDGEWPLQLLC